VDFVLPGHGEPLLGHRAWIQKTKEHHAERLERIHQIVIRNAATAHEIAGQLWDRALDPIHYRFAIFEVLAHLVHLRSQGLVERGENRWRQK
jgi:hypothetical protein